MAKIAALSLAGRLKGNALFRLTAMAVCLLIWLVGFGGLAMPALKELGEPGTFSGDSARLLGAVVYSAVALCIYWLLVSKIECRRLDELRIDTGLPLGVRGMAFGLMLFCLVVGVLFATGAANYNGFGDGSRLFAVLAASIMASVGEELLFRGVMFRIFEQATGTLTALLVSALFFGMAHLASPNVTVLTAFAIAIEAGLLLGLAYVVTRNLWFPIGIHFAWNFTQSGIFGITNGGASSYGLVAMNFAGPDWLTGGTFGPEASVVSIAVCLAAAVACGILVSRRGQWESKKFRLRMD
jgi:membrane protease YdiL (CAAX protease family)